LIDGEGAISLWRSPKGYSLVVQVGMTVKGLPALEAMKSWYGGSLRVSRQKTQRWAEARVWTICGDSAARILEEIGPFLILKQEHAKVALEFHSLPRPMKSPEHAALWERMRALNRKGPAIQSSSPGAFAIFADGRWWKTQGSLFSATGLEPFSET